MNDEALLALAGATVSRTRAVLFGVAVVVIAFLAALALGSWNGGQTAVSAVMWIGLVAVVGSLNWVRKIRPTPHSVPTLRCMRDRPTEVHTIVGIEKGAQYLAVTDRDGALLAPPMEIVASVSSGVLDDVVLSYRADAPPSPNLDAALRLASQLCPDARVTTARDNIGLSSLAGLARKASLASRADA